MWPPSMFWFLQLWLSAWLAGLATTTAYRLPMLTVSLAPHRLRTPLLSLHAQTLKLNPYAGLPRPRGWLRPHLHLVQPDERGS